MQRAAKRVKIKSRGLNAKGVGWVALHPYKGDSMKRMDIAIKTIGDEYPAEFILSHLLMGLHWLFIKQQDEDGLIRIGIGFPEYDTEKQTLGKIISLFGDEDSLAQLNLPHSTPDLRDFIRVSSPVEVVSPGKYTIFQKAKPKGHPENKIRRAMRRHGLTREEAERRYSEYQAQDRHSRVKGLPYLKLYSKSTRQTYPVYIRRVEAHHAGERFNTFGLAVGRKESGGVPL